MAERESIINEALTDDELHCVLSKLEREEDRDGFGLVCRRWLRLQSTSRSRLRARAGPAMLRRMAGRFSGVLDLDLSQSTSRSFFPGVTDSDLSVVAAGFPKLRVLSLHNCKSVSDAGMMVLGNGLSFLQSLDVSYCRKLTDKGLTAIALGCCDLRRLQLLGCKLITDRIFKALSQNCSHLEELGLSGCVNISDSGLSSLVEGCHYIKSLDVSKCSKIGDVGVLRIAEVCSPSLRTLKLLECHNVSNKSIHSLAYSCRNLETLVIGGCREVFDEPLKFLVLALSYSLRSLRMDWCLNITDSSLSCVLSNCRFLVALDISCCDKVSDYAFLGLGMDEGFKSDLKVLKMSNLPRITISGIGTILQFCKSLEYVDLRSLPHVTEVSCEEAGLKFPDSCKVNFSGNLLEVNPMVDLYF